MYTHTVKHGRIDVHEVVVSELLRSEGDFTKEDVLERIGRRIAPYQKDCNENEKWKTTLAIRDHLEYIMTVFSQGNLIEYVGDCTYRCARD